MDPIQITAIIITALFIVAAIGSAFQYLEKSKGPQCKVVRFNSPKVSMYHQLSLKERDLYGLLHTVSGNSEYHKLIHDVLDSGDIIRFRGLIKEWQDQAVNHPDAVKNIIGRCAFSRLMDLQSAIV
jgi:hypothetical protein